MIFPYKPSSGRKAYENFMSKSWDKVHLLETFFGDHKIYIKIYIKKQLQFDAATHFSNGRCFIQGASH